MADQYFVHNCVIILKGFYIMSHASTWLKHLTIVQKLLKDFSYTFSSYELLSKSQYLLKYYFGQFHLYCLKWFVFYKILVATMLIPDICMILEKCLQSQRMWLVVIRISIFPVIRKIRFCSLDIQPEFQKLFILFSIINYISEILKH